MVPRESIDGRLARIEEGQRALTARAIEDREEARSDRKDIMSRLDGVAQTLNSTANAVAILRVEKCGERLDGHDRRIDILEGSLSFWRGGATALWKLLVIAVGSSALTSAVVHFWPK